MLKLKFEYLLVCLLVLIKVGCQSYDNNQECDQLLCAPVVSKCLLTQSCNCKISDCHCCKDCILCLGRLFHDCCGCLEMCPQGRPKLAAKSQIGDFEGVPALFKSVVKDKHYREWTVIEMRMRESLELSMANSIDQDDIKQSIPKSHNQTCSLLYIKSCMPFKKCTEYCESIVSAF